MALTEVYAYYAGTEPMMTSLARRAEDAGAGGAAGAYDRYLAAVRDVLAAVGHALDFATWRSLVRGRGRAEQMAVELMVRLVRGAARG